MQFFETIKIEGNRLFNLEYHQERMDRTRLEILGLNTPIHLFKKISIPKKISGEIRKCRVSYSEQIEKIKIEPYQPRLIQSLKIIFGDEVDYNYKFSDRTTLNKLLSQKGDCDDILIVKNNMVTDTSFSNIVFFDGQKFITPSLPLLKGTMRQKLLDENKIFEAKIDISDIKNFQSAFLINAMLDLEETIEIKIKNIT